VYNCVFKKVDWLVACIALGRRIGSFPSMLANNVNNPPTNGKQGLVSEERSHTLLNNKEQGNLD
jgi:hypothetical protein